MEKWQQRVVDEKAALDEKIKALATFINKEEAKWDGDNPEDPNDSIDLGMLWKQRKAMVRYSAVLNERIILF